MAQQKVPKQGREDIRVKGNINNKALHLLRNRVKDVGMKFILSICRPVMRLHNNVW